MPTCYGCLSLNCVANARGHSFGVKTGCKMIFDIFFYVFWAFILVPTRFETAIGNVGCNHLYKLFGVLVNWNQGQKLKWKKHIHPISCTNNNTLTVKPFTSCPQMIPLSIKSAQFQRANFNRFLSETNGILLNRTSPILFIYIMRVKDA